MPTVIARLEPKSDAHDAVLDVLREHVPLVHAEAGCDLYSVHSDGRIIVIVESWETGSALKSHATGPGWRLGHGQVRKDDQPYATLDTGEGGVMVFIAPGSSTASGTGGKASLAPLERFGFTIH